MTMTHIATKAISRKSGQSAVACAAYRSGDVLDDAKYGKTHDYSKKAGVLSSDIVLPSSLRAFGVSVNRESLWNVAEAAETRSDSRVAREWLINLPYELDEYDRQMLAIDFAQKLCDDMNVIADVCIHRPVMKLPFDPDAKPSSKRLREGEENPDPRNFHAHIMVTTRSPLAGPNRTLAFDPNLKIPFEWSNAKRKAHDLPSSMQEIKRIRELWVDTANSVLSQYNLPLMDARSYKDQGIDQQPTIKMGVEATAMERRGITTEKGNTNRAIKARNQAVTEQTIQRRAEYERRARELRTGLAWTTKTNTRLPILIGDAKQRSDLAKQLTGRSERHIEYCNEHSHRAAERANSTKRCIESAESSLEWTAKRCENLPKRGDDTQQRIERSKRRVTANSKRARDSESIARSIHQGIANSAPSPFNDDARRARAARLTEQERQADRNARDYCNSDERVFDYAKRVPILLANKLGKRNDVKNRIRWESNETAENYPDKYDKRQMAKLDTFAQSLGLEKQPYDYRVAEDIASKFTVDFVEQHKAVFELLMNPKSERAAYDLITTDYHSFIATLDAARAVENKEWQQQLGSSETSRMTAETMTVTRYLHNLDRYIDDEDTAEECKDLARENIAKTFTTTCSQYRHAYQDLKYLDSNDSIQKHLQLLETSLNQFINEYGQRLSEDNLKDISVGQNVLQESIEIRNTYGSSFGFR